MLASIYTDFVEKLKSIGIYHWQVRCQGGNRVIYNNDKPDILGKDVSSKIILDGDELVVCEMTRASVMSERTFDVSKLNIENCDSISVQDCPVDKTKELIHALGIWDEEWDEFFRNIPHKRDLRIEKDGSNAGLRVLRNEDGEPILPPHSSGMITSGKS